MTQHGPGRDIPRTLTASEAAALIGVSVATVRGWADNGLIPSHRTIGGHRRFEVAELRQWLADRGAPVAERLRPRTVANAEIIACPRVARELNARTDAIVERVQNGYRAEIPTRVPRSTEASLRRSTVRFLRVAAGALESGRLTSSIGRAELAGYRAGLQGPAGLGVAVELTRIAIALCAEAEDIVANDRDAEPDAIPALLAVVDAMQAAVINGLLTARETGGAPPAPAPEVRSEVSPAAGAIPDAWED